MNQKDGKDLIIQAQRKLKEVTLDFGSEFASNYHRRIDNLCQEIINSLESNNKALFIRSEAKLQDVLYELNREVRLQYDAEWNTNFPKQVD